jgi:hypothetical protein
MKLPLIVTALLVLTTPAFAGVPHHRPCDWAQEHPEQYLEKLFRKYPALKGGNSIRLGLCDALPDKSETEYQGDWHKAINCGYQAYREGKPLKANPYPEPNAANAYRHAWAHGWTTAKKACTSGKLPF